MKHGLLRRIWWHVNRTPAQKAIKAARRAVARSEIAERRALARTLERGPQAAAVAANLRRDGYSRADALIAPESLAALDRALAAKLDAPRTGGSVFGDHKDIWRHLLDADMVDGSLPADSPFARFALQPAVLAALAEYYGELPRLDYVTVTYSGPAEGELRFSQLWHRDYDDTKVVKLFVYLTDVGDEDGPFTFLPGPQSDRIGFSLRSHRPDAAIAARADLGAAVRMTAPRLSAFLVETSRCLHMGSRVAAGHERLMYTATFISTPIIFPERAQPFFRLAGSESAVERRVLSAG
jgi:phytanoyl-CoA dioxygenase PhyH